MVTKAPTLKDQANDLAGRLARLGKRASGADLRTEVRTMFRAIDSALADAPEDSELQDLGATLEQWIDVLNGRA